MDIGGQWQTIKAERNRRERPCDRPDWKDLRERAVAQIRRKLGPAYPYLRAEEKEALIRDMLRKPR